MVLYCLNERKKLSFRGHVYFQPVSRTKLLSALIYLKANNPLYYDITTDMSEITSDLITFSDELIDKFLKKVAILWTVTSKRLTSC